MKKIYKMKNLILALFLLFALPAMAQTGFEEDVEDVPAEPQAPIDSLVVFGLAAGTLLAYKLIGKKQSSYN